jgi:hypothetical protein
MIHLKDLTTQEVDIILAGLRELPKKIADALHDKIFHSASQQFQAIQKAAQEANSTFDAEQQSEKPSE